MLNSVIVTALALALLLVVALPAAYCLSPVSYTHLDVYKRQLTALRVSWSRVCSPAWLNTTRQNFLKKLCAA